MFRRRMISKKLSVVTLEEPLAALSDNYLKIVMSRPRPAQQLIDLEIGSVSETALCEATPLAIIT